jgi:hypothetical protein
MDGLDSSPRGWETLLFRAISEGCRSISNSTLDCGSLDSTDGLVEHLRTSCIGGHSAVQLAARSLTLPCQPPSAGTVSDLTDAPWVAADQSADRRVVVRGAGPVARSDVPLLPQPGQVSLCGATQAERPATAGCQPWRPPGRRISPIRPR